MTMKTKITVSIVEDRETTGYLSAWLSNQHIAAWPEGSTDPDDVETGYNLSTEDKEKLLNAKLNPAVIWGECLAKVTINTPTGPA